MAQPADDAAVLVPDIVLVPLVLADRSGGRLGRGKGHYDRALAGLDAVAIGLAWDVQLSDTALPLDSWDARLDAIATPENATPWLSDALDRGDRATAPVPVI